MNEALKHIKGFQKRTSSFFLAALSSISFNWPSTLLLVENAVCEHPGLSMKR